LNWKMAERSSMNNILLFLVLTASVAFGQAVSQKISQLPSGAPAQPGDLVPIARGGNNYSLTALSIAALGTSGGGVGTITGVTAGAGLLGGGTTGVVTVSIAPTISSGSCTLCNLTYNAQGQLVGATSGSSGLPASPQIGDGLRYNLYGDGLWDPTSAGYGRLVTIFYGYLNNSFNATNSVAAVNVINTGGSLTFVNPSATDQAGGVLTSSSSASASTVIGMTQGIGANSAEYGFGSFYRWSMRFAAGNTNNVRYWLGLTSFNTGGSGCETAQPLNSTRFATNAPNCTTLAFRYVAGTDTAWQCTSQVTGGSQTVTTTGVTPDTNNHTFEITYDGTNERCFIDGVLKATVSTNTPAGSTFHMLQFWTGDNMNTANAVSGTMLWSALALK
jgi:hypothetical protein